MFNEESYIVKVWVRNVAEKGYLREDVPAISNLQEIVYRILDGGTSL